MDFRQAREDSQESNKLHAHKNALNISHVSVSEFKGSVRRLHEEYSEFECPNLTRVLPMGSWVPPAFFCSFLFLFERAVHRLIHVGLQAPQRTWRVKNQRVHETVTTRLRKCTRKGPVISPHGLWIIVIVELVLIRS